jgi:Transposase DDE domain.
VHNGGDWIRKVWKVKGEGLSKTSPSTPRQSRPYPCMHVTSEVHDGKVLRRLVRGGMKSVKVRRVLADGAYDSRENFNFLSQSGIKPVIRVRVNSVARSEYGVSVCLEGMLCWRVGGRLGLGLGAGCIVLVLGGLLRAFPLL